MTNKPQHPETFDDLWKYCTSHNRLCPKNNIWQEVFELLKNTQELSGHGGVREPADPYIIYNNWGNIMPIELQFQFNRYLEWAQDNDQLNEVGKYLRSLPESDWVHFGEY